jgi:hypothetical protein
VFSKEFCTELDASIGQEIREYPTYSLGNIMRRQYRLDYPLPLTPLYSEALALATKVVYGGIREIVGDNAVLVEFAALYSYPQAKRQNRHPDFAMEEVTDIKMKNKIVTVFVYLDDINRDMAALDIWPGTHTHFHFLLRAERQMMTSVPAVRMAVNAGSFVIYDARTLHRGSENTSRKKRPTLYFSFMEKSPEKEVPQGPTYSARKSYFDAQIRLVDIVTKNNPFGNFTVTDEELKEQFDECRSIFRKACCSTGTMPCQIGTFLSKKILVNKFSWQ